MIKLAIGFFIFKILYMWKVQIKKSIPIKKSEIIYQLQVHTQVWQEYL
jgi:hypothetical protein